MASWTIVARAPAIPERNRQKSGKRGQAVIGIASSAHAKLTQGINLHSVSSFRVSVSPWGESLGGQKVISHHARSWLEEVWSDRMLDSSVVPS